MNDHRAAVACRVASAVGGAYLFAWGSTALGAALLAWLGMARSEAVTLFSMLSYVIYLVAALWAVAARRLWRVAAVLFAGGAAMTALAHQLGRSVS